MAAKSHVKERAQGTERPPQAGGPGRCPGRADSGAEPRGGPSGGLTARGGEVISAFREAERGLVQQRSPKPQTRGAAQTMDRGSGFTLGSLGSCGNVGFLIKLLYYGLKNNHKLWHF